MNFNNASCFDSRPQDILLSWHVVLGAKTVEVIEETVKTHHVVSTIPNDDDDLFDQKWQR